MTALSRAAAWLLALLLAAAALVWGVTRALGGLIDDPLDEPAPAPEPPDLSDEREAVEAEVDAMDRDELADELRERGF